MKIVVFALIALALFAIYRYRTAPKPAKGDQEDQVPLHRVGAVYESLRNTGSDGSFAVFMPGSTAGAPDVQFSIQRGRVGLDWLLIGDANIRGQEAFEKLLDSEEASYREQELNGVRFVRTEDERAPQLCRRVLEEIFEVDPQGAVTLIVESFQWPPKHD